MKKLSWRWWLLGALVIVMVWVWYNGFQTICPEAPGMKVTAPMTPRKVEVSPAGQLRYEPTRTNPFLRPGTAQADQSGRPNNAREALPGLKQQYRLIGLLNQQRQSQAVIGFGDSSVVISPGDSLGVWQLLQILPNAAIFGHDKKHDTLWLYTPSR